MESCPVCAKPLERKCATFMTIAACTGCAFKEVVSVAPMPPETHYTTNETVVFNLKIPSQTIEV